jgi:hypothetical protein
VGDYKAAVDWANNVLEGSGDGKCFTDGQARGIKNSAGKATSDSAGSSGSSSLEFWSGLTEIGRASSYALMMVHAKTNSLEKMESVWKQLKRLESFGLANMVF